MNDKDKDELTLSFVARQIEREEAQLRRIKKTGNAAGLYALGSAVAFVFFIVSAGNQINPTFWTITGVIGSFIATIGLIGGFVTCRVLFNQIAGARNELVNRLHGIFGHRLPYKMHLKWRDL